MDARLDLEKVRKFIFQICFVVVVTSLVLFGGIYGITNTQTTNLKETISLVVRESIKDELNLFYNYMRYNISTYVDKQFEKLDRGDTPNITDLKQIVTIDRYTLEAIGQLTGDLEKKIERLSDIYYSSL